MSKLKMKQETETRLFTIKQSLHYLKKDLIEFSEPFGEQYSPRMARATEKGIKRLEKEYLILTTIKIDTSALDVPISELEDMTEAQRVDEQCYAIFGEAIDNWSYVSCGQSGFSEETITELVNEKKATLCEVTDIDGHEFRIIVFDIPVEEIEEVVREVL